MRCVLSAVGFLGLFAASCSSDGDAMQKRLSSLREDITRLQAENDRLGERVGRLESTPAAAPAASASPASAKLERPPLKIIKLVPGADTQGVGDLPSSNEVIPEESPNAPGDRPVIRLRGTKQESSRGEESDDPARDARQASSGAAR